MLYRVLADVTVVIHLAYASFIVLGLVAILLGILRRWSWIRDFWFRLVHLLLATFVAAPPGRPWHRRLTTDQRPPAATGPL